MNQTHPPALWRVELHCHTRYSPDSMTSARAIIASARKRNLQRIAITDHNRIAGALEAQKLAPDMVIVGEEIMTTQGEIIAWFVQELVPKGLTPAETIRRLRTQGAVIGIPHPLDSLRKSSAMGREATLAIIGDVDALEVLNARSANMADNEQARALAQAHNKLMTAGSDAHTPGEIGRAVVVMPPFHDADSFRTSLAQSHIEGRLSGHHVHIYSTYAKIHKRIFGRTP